MSTCVRPLRSWPNASTVRGVGRGAGAGVRGSCIYIYGDGASYSSRTPQVYANYLSGSNYRPWHQLQVCSRSRSKSPRSGCDRSLTSHSISSYAVMFLHNMHASVQYASKTFYFILSFTEKISIFLAVVPKVTTLHVNRKHTWAEDRRRGKCRKRFSLWTCRLTWSS